MLNLLSLLKSLPAIKITAVYLGLLSIIAVGVKLDLEYTLTRGLAFGALFAGFMVIPAVKHRAGALKHPFFTNNLITILILYLILDEFIPVWQFFAFGLLASGIKHFIRLNRQVIFNPAAAGLVVAVALGALETWWGASFAPRIGEIEVSSAVFLTVPIGLYLIFKYKKWGTALSFLGFYGLAMTLWLMDLPIYQLIEGTMLFFAFIMVSEPKTSPNKVLHQVIFGSFVGVGSVLALIWGVASPYATALLIANLGFRLFMWWQQKQLMKKNLNKTPVMTGNSPATS